MNKNLLNRQIQLNLPLDVRLDANLGQDFIEFAIKNNILSFGEFITKAGRKSPYFFNTGKFYNGASLFALGSMYAQKLLSLNIKYDILFGPAYKGIPLVISTAMALAIGGSQEKNQKEKNVDFAFNRKELKDHGEGGNIIGAPIKPKSMVIILDDVISSGISIIEAIKIIRDAGAIPAAILVALDRMEQGKTSGTSAAQEITAKESIPVFALANIFDILRYLRNIEQNNKSHYDISPNKCRQYAEMIEIYLTQHGS